ncbi:MAG: DUF4129 domain-containing protein [Planctomycetota bacterium]|jgi:hypothetical protein
MEVVICLLLLAAPTDRVDQAARRILSDDAYQTELPEGTYRPDTEAPSEPPSDSDMSAGQIEVPDAVATIAQLVWWILVGVAAAVALLWLARELAARYEKPPPPAPAAPGAAKETASPAPTDPDALAAAGRFGEAIHALLLRVLLELRRRARIRPAWTSREVVTHVPLADVAEERLRALVHAVERTHFGGVPADAAEYRRRADDTAALLAELPRGPPGG